MAWDKQGLETRLVSSHKVCNFLIMKIFNYINEYLELLYLRMEASGAARAWGDGGLEIYEGLEMRHVSSPRCELTGNGLGRRGSRQLCFEAHGSNLYRNLNTVHRNFNYIY
jgi:hypothetical protein